MHEDMLNPQEYKLTQTFIVTDTSLHHDKHKPLSVQMQVSVRLNTCPCQPGTISIR